MLYSDAMFYRGMFSDRGGLTSLIFAICGELSSCQWCTLSKRGEARWQKRVKEKGSAFSNFFCFSGSFIDINIPDFSKLFSDVIAGQYRTSAPSVEIEVFKLDWYYWLVEEIYPRWRRFLYHSELHLLLCASH